MVKIFISKLLRMTHYGLIPGETAKGDYPLQCIQTMANLSREAESCLWNQRFFDDLQRSHQLDNEAMDTTQATAIAAVQASYGVKAAAIINLTSCVRRTP